MKNKTLSYYKSLEYNIIIKREEFEGEKWFVAYCNEFGLYACHGKGETEEEAIKSFKEEKNIFIEYLYSKGEVIPEVEIDEYIPFSGTFTVRTSPWLHEYLVKQSKINRVSLNSYLNQLLSFRAGQNDISERYLKKVDYLHNDLYKCTNDIMHKIQMVTYKIDPIKSQTGNSFSNYSYAS